MNILNISEIIRLTDAVYESSRLSLGQDAESFKEIKDKLNPKRYVQFVCNKPHLKWQYALTKNLQSIGDGSAVTVQPIDKKGEKLVFADKGPLHATIVDMSKINNITEEQALLSVIENTMTKMRAAKTVEQMRSGISQIKEAAGQTKAGIGSRKVNVLKEVIEKASENTK